MKVQKTLSNKLRTWQGGKLLAIHICEMPIKCPVAPLEFAFLADSYFKNKGMRDNVDISFVTPIVWRIYQTKSNRSIELLFIRRKKH